MTRVGFSAVVTGWGLIAPLLLLPAATQAQTVENYVQAKAKADADEAALPTITANVLHQAQKQLSEASVAQCATPNPDLTAFVVVVQLDADGRVTRTWRQGDSPLAICFENQLSGKVLPAPSSSAAPFFASFEMSFTP